MDHEVGWAGVERMNDWMDSAMKPLKGRHAYCRGGGGGGGGGGCCGAFYIFRVARPSDFQTARNTPGSRFMPGIQTQYRAHRPPSFHL